MRFKKTLLHKFSTQALLVFFILAITGCDATRHLRDGEYLLRRNNLKLETDKGITRKGEFKDNITHLIVQKPNTYLLFGYFPYKVWLYNLRYEKYRRDTANFQLKSKTVEVPVVFDSSLVSKSVQNIKSYLFNQGYFYPQVSDTVIFRDKKAYVNYNVKTGTNFLIRKITLDVDDSLIKKIVSEHMDETLLKEGTDFSMSLLEQERSRIAQVLRNSGYYRFTPENIVDFSLDTFNKELLKDAENPFESALNFLAAQKKTKKPTLDIQITIREENPDAYRRHIINQISVFPDFKAREDVRDSTMYESEINGIRFRFHDHYVKETIILKYLYLEEGKLYSQQDYDETINKLNQLGVFQTIRIILVNDTARYADSSLKSLNAFVLMTPAKKYDLTTSLEVSTGTTYLLGTMPTVSFRNLNLAKGANLLTTSVSGGLESNYNSGVGDNFFEHFSLITKTFSLNASIDFPKFLGPFKSSFTKRNLPRTVVGLGTSMLDRINYFTLTNTSASFLYNWRETSTNTWEVSPAFVNIIRLPKVSDSFKRRLENNDFLANSYRETFIEGENFSFTFSNQLDRKGKSYTYARLGLEEAGALMSGLSDLSLLHLDYASYVKFDFDVRRYINRRRSQTAFRFYGGIGVPYGESPTLPYVKQYFVGGAYSIRGWRIRTLGPGSYYNPEDETSNGFIDRTGDMKLEANAEYRFDIIQLFSGAIKLKGALFADAGNIWLMKESSGFPGGAFRFKNLGNDIAVSTGAGARLDIGGFFIVRFDGAFPVKQPYNEFYQRGGWSNPFSGGLNIRDMVLNIAVGYPF